MTVYLMALTKDECWLEMGNRPSIYHVTNTRTANETSVNRHMYYMTVFSGKVRVSILTFLLSFATPNTIWCILCLDFLFLCLGNYVISYLKTKVRFLLLESLLFLILAEKIVVTYRTINALFVVPYRNMALERWSSTRR